MRHSFRELKRGQAVRLPAVLLEKTRVAAEAVLGEGINGKAVAGVRGVKRTAAAERQKFIAKQLSFLVNEMFDGGNSSLGKELVESRTTNAVVDVVNGAKCRLPTLVSKICQTKTAQIKEGAWSSFSLHPIPCFTLATSLAGSSDGCRMLLTLSIP